MKQIKENNFPTAQYPELEKISQTDQLPFRHKRRSQIFKAAQHPMPRRVTMLAFQKVSAFLLLIFWFSTHLPVCSACGQAVIPMGARDDNKRRWAISSSSGRDNYSISVEASFLPCLHSSYKFLTAHIKQQLLYVFLWLFSVVCHRFWHRAACTKCSVKESRADRATKDMGMLPRKREEKETLSSLMAYGCSVTDGVKCAYLQLPLQSPPPRYSQLLPESATSLAGDLSPVMRLAGMELYLHCFVSQDGSDPWRRGRCTAGYVLYIVLNSAISMRGRSREQQ